MNQMANKFQDVIDGLRVMPIRDALDLVSSRTEGRRNWISKHVCDCEGITDEYLIMAVGAALKHRVLPVLADCEELARLVKP